MKINRNIAWAETFVKELVAGGVKYACISPGSRNTPLTWAFAQNKKIKKLKSTKSMRYYKPYPDPFHFY